MRGALRAHVVILLLVGCGLRYDAPEDKRTWQRRQARALAPAKLQAEPVRWGRRHTIRARVYVAAADGRMDQARRDAFEDQLDRANEVLLSAVDARVEVDEYRVWQPRAPTADLTTLLSEFVALDPATDVDWVIGLVGASPLATLSFTDLGRANVLGKHALLRDMRNAAEVRAFDEGLDALEVTERAELVVKRRRHRAVSVLLHEIGHLLGAIHTVESHWFMHPQYDADQQAYAPQNVEIMRKVIEFRAREDQDGSDVYQVVRKHLDDSDGWSGWVPAELAAYREDLARGSVPRAPSAEAETNAARPPTTPANADPARNTDALAPADREVFAGLLAASEAGEVGSAWEGIVALAAKYPDAYAVQRLACDSGMRARLSGKAMRGYCRRMMDLAMKLPAAGSPDTAAKPSP